MSNIILVVVVGICVLVLFWCIKNGNNIKRDKKPKNKEKKPAEEKFKDVIPKEKVKKEPIIKDSVKKDLKKEKEENSTVSKITKEDFTNNDMTIPTALLSDSEKTEKAKEIARQGKPPAPKPFDFNFDNEFKPMKAPIGDNPFKFDEDLDSLFSAPKKPTQPPKFDFADVPKFDFAEDELDFDPFDMPKSSEVKPRKDVFDKSNIKERFNKVFGEKSNKGETNTEVILGEIISKPRATVNRLNRRKYF